MEYVNVFLSFMNSQDFAVPLGQVVLLVFMTTVCLLFARYKLGLMISYAFVLYWGYIFNREEMFDRFGRTTVGLLVYIGFGVLMFALTVVRFFAKED